MKAAYLYLPLLIYAGFRTANPVTSTPFECPLSLCDSGAIIWDQSSLKKIAPATGIRQHCGYARMVQLHDRSLIVIYEASGNVLCAKSNDFGNSWSSPMVVAAKTGDVIMAAPSILELKDHTLLACYNPRPLSEATSKKFGIRTKRSSDGGKSWREERLVYEAGGQFENGCWEPAAIQLPDGKVQLFFANEGLYTSSAEQNISVLSSTDGGLRWTNQPIIASFRKNRRDGMPVPLLLRNGKEILFSIEDNGTGNFKPSLIRNPVQGAWKEIVDDKSVHRHYALKEPIADSLYAGAPFLRQLTTGQTILSYQGTEGRLNKMEFADMKVVVGDELAKNFSGKTIPFLIPADKHCLWNSLCVLDDNTIIAITSTNAFSDWNEVYMIKGRLRENRMLLADPTIFRNKDMYYLYGTSSAKGFEVFQSRNLVNWSRDKGAADGLALREGDSFGTRGFWAPQVFKYRSHFYMAYTANEQIAIAKGDSPVGPFKQTILRSISGEGRQIDPFVFFDTNGKIYLYHVKLKNGNRIYVSEMKSDLSDIVTGSSQECIFGELKWENTENAEWPVTEGPSVIKHKGLYYLIYSANDFRNKEYAVGYATSATPTGPWKKYTGNPIISRKSIGFNGVGHGDLFANKSGKMRYVVHTHYSNSAVSPRATGIIDIRFLAQQGRPDILSVDTASFRFLNVSRVSVK